MFRIILSFEKKRKKCRAKIAERFSRLIRVCLIFSFRTYDSYLHCSAFRARRGSFKQAQVVEPHRLRALTEQLFVYSRGREFIITAGGEAGVKETEEGGLIIFRRRRMLARSLARSCNLFGAAAPHVEFVGKTLKCGAFRKKYVGARARDNRIMESSRRFFCATKRDIRVMHLVALYRAPLVSPRFFLDNPSAARPAGREIKSSKEYFSRH